MSNKVLISLVVIFIVISAFAFLYFYSHQNKTIFPPSAEQAQQEAIINELNSFKPDPNTKTPQEIIKELGSVKQSKTSSTADILNSLNSIQP